MFVVVFEEFCVGGGESYLFQIQGGAVGGESRVPYSLGKIKFNER